MRNTDLEAPLSIFAQPFSEMRRDSQRLSRHIKTVISRGVEKLRDSQSDYRATYQTSILSKVEGPAPKWHCRVKEKGRLSEPEPKNLRSLALFVPNRKKTKAAR